MKQNKKWTFYACLFSGLACFSYYSVVFFSDLEPRHQNKLLTLFPPLIVLLSFNIIGFLAVWISNYVHAFINNPLKRKREFIINGMLAAFGLFTINYLTLSITKYLLNIPNPFTIYRIGWIALFWIWLIEIVVVTLIMMVSSYKQLAELREKTARLEENNLKARYRALQNQLNPHFLFNSLNTLVAEIEYNPKNAVLFTQNLSDVYRYILKSQQEGIVTWQQEQEFLDSYLFLHRVRLGDCIHLNRQYPESLNHRKIPALTLQLLIENVIKHNVIHIGKPMVIDMIYIQEKDMVAIHNNINLKKDVISLGNGLKNLSERYMMISGRDIEIEKDSTDFTVNIPILD
ncbi:MAG: histidine kinase [Parabacteroides sp.]|nr:histidine kinase [Parabacteroides sp.]